MGKVVALFNQKGGVGKTTTNINLSSCIAKLGKKVLVIDIDSQGNSTSGFGINKKNLEHTIYECLVDDINVRDAIVKTGVENLDIIPSNVELAGVEIELTEKDDRENYLKKVINEIRHDYDYIFIDCPPSLGLITINALVAVDSVIIPIQCEYYALEGVSQLIDTIKLVRRGLNSEIEVEGVLLSMFDGRTNLSIQVVDEVKRFFKDKVYHTIIPRNVRLAEAPSFGLSIVDYAPKSKGAIAFMNLAEEFIQLQRM